MKLQGVNILLFIATTGLVRSVNSICVVRNAVWPEYIWYQCSESTAEDYLTDVKRAPLGLERISFTNSDIPILKNASFSRLGQTLEFLVTSHCKLEKIEDRAFEGLTDLVFLDLNGNKLKSLKGAWFEDLPNVQFIHLKYNQISHIEDSFYTTLPRLEILDLANNRLKCLSVASMTDFYVKELNLVENPLTWRCISAISDWAASDNVEDINLAGFEVTRDVTKSCIAKSPTSDPEDNFINICVEESLNKLLPAEENYTTERLCQFLADKPASYLDCAK